MAKKDYVSLKLTEYNTIRLLQLYQGEPCLYDINTEDYRNRNLRIAALKRIAAALSVDGFGPKEVAAKFKNLRNSYSQELKKIKDSEVSGARGEDLYVPKVYWFSVMDSFIRPYLYSRHIQTNMGLKHKSLTKKTLSPEYHGDGYGDENDDEDGTFIIEDQRTPSVNRDDENDTKSFIKTRCIQALQEEVEDSRSGGSNQRVVQEENCTNPVIERGIKRKRSIHSEATSSKRQSDTSTAANRLYEITRLAASMVSNKCDMYSHFGDYIASVLRETGGQKAVLMQRDVCNVIFTHLSGLSPSPSVLSHVSSNTAFPCESFGNESSQEEI